MFILILSSNIPSNLCVLEDWLRHVTVTSSGHTLFSNKHTIGIRNIIYDGEGMWGTWKEIKGRNEYDATRREKQIDEFVLQLMLSAFSILPTAAIIMHRKT